MTSRFAAAVKASLHLNGITQSTWARELGVSENTVSRWVTDICLPDRESLNTVREYFGWNEDKLLLLLEDWYENVDAGTDLRVSGPSFVRSRYDDDYVAFTKDILEFDRRFFISCSDTDLGSVDQWSPIFAENTDSWRILTRKGEIVGYWQYVIMKDEFFRLKMDGSITDSEITLDMTEFPFTSGFYNAYFPAFLIDTAHRNPASFDILLNSLKKILEDFARKERYFRSVGAHAFTPMGVKMCEALGLTKRNEIETSQGDRVAVYMMNGSEMKNSYIARNSAIGKLYSAKYG